jgi:hypothetical protein
VVHVRWVKAAIFRHVRKIVKQIIDLVVFVRLPVRHSTLPHGTPLFAAGRIFMRFGIRGFLKKKSVEKIEVPLKSEKKKKTGT